MLAFSNSEGTTVFPSETTASLCPYSQKVSPPDVASTGEPRTRALRTSQGVMTAMHPTEMVTNRRILRGKDIPLRNRTTRQNRRLQARATGLHRVARPKSAPSMRKRNIVRLRSRSRYSAITAMMISRKEKSVSVSIILEKEASSGLNAVRRPAHHASAPPEALYPSHAIPAQTSAPMKACHR